jgi:hypothetical protein
MNVNWSLTCTKEKAINVLKDNIDGPMSPAFMGKSYKGFISDDSFSIWSKIDRFGSRTAIARGTIVSRGEESYLEAKINVSFPFNLAPDSARFYWIVVPLTILLWVSDIIIIVTEKYSYLATFTFPLTMVGILLMLLGFMKMMGGDNTKLLEKQLRSIFQNHIK